MSTENDAQITCRFKSKLPAKYQVPLSEIAIPASLTRYGLSQVVNHLLDLSESVPFDFLVNGELIRLPLEKVLLVQGISAESVLEIEYIFAVTPPRLKKQILHDDWVSAIDGSLSGQIFSGCYDGMLRIWDGAGNKLGEAQAHNGPISALQSIEGRQETQVLSAGKLDHVARLLQVPSDPAELCRGALSCVAVFRGHSGSVLALAAEPQGERFVSASQDKTLRIWTTGNDTIHGMHELEEESGKKKRKAGSGRALNAQAPEIAHASELSGHNDGVTSVIWSTPETITSGSMDHTLREWDSETSTNTNTLHCKNAVYDLSASPQNPTITAFAGAGKALHIWDARQRSADGSGLKSFSSHKSFVHAVEWRPAAEHHVATASMDKTTKLWDIRASIPLCTLEGHTEQVLCLAWWEGGKIVSGSADNTIRIYNSELQESP